MLRAWQQDGPKTKRAPHECCLTEISEGASFLEVLGILNEQLFAAGEGPIAFDSDYRESICGMRRAVINGVPHGPHKDRTTTYQLHMCTFKDDGTVTIESRRSKASSILRDLVINREAYDRIVQTGEYISVDTGATLETHSVLVPKGNANMAFETAAHIGYGTYVAACPNGSAMSFASAKVMHSGLLPQGKPENYDRVANTLSRHGTEGSGAYQNTGGRTKICPKQIPLDCISYLSHQLGKTLFKGK